jgi:hypothetical protein
MMDSSKVSTKLEAPMATPTYWADKYIENRRRGSEAIQRIIPENASRNGESEKNTKYPIRSKIAHTFFSKRSF